jgi:hypothetical protein
MEFDWNNPVVAEQVPINQAIVEGLIDFIPESWRAAELRLGFNAPEGGVAQQVVNPDTGEGWTVSHELMMAVLQLDGHRRKFALGWKSAVYGVRLTDADEWKVSVSFE